MAPKVAARLISEQTAVAPAGSVTIALEEKIQPQWHTYWINPGDAGSPTAINWTLPPGWHAGAIQWPTPKRLPVMTLMDYGYEGTLWLLTSITAPADARMGDTVTLKASASWLVCKNICIPEEAVLTLPLKIGAGAPDPAVAKQFAAARALLPVASPWKLSYARGQSLDLYAAAPALAAAHPARRRLLSLEIRHGQQCRAPGDGFRQGRAGAAPDAGSQAATRRAGRCAGPEIQRRLDTGADRGCARRARCPMPILPPPVVRAASRWFWRWASPFWAGSS